MILNKFRHIETKKYHLGGIILAYKHKIIRNKPVIVSFISVIYPLGSRDGKVRWFGNGENEIANGFHIEKIHKAKR